MKNLTHTAVVTLFAASAVHAQEAVQWKVSDGGNGGLPLESRTPPVGRIAPARRSVFHVHDASLYP
jgi:hypothetical protein